MAPFIDSLINGVQGREAANAGLFTKLMARRLRPAYDSCNKRPSLKGISTSGVGLIAMIVGDSGIASCQPEWWNASPLGCFLIGLQPRGGWQILQRGVQWGSDSFAGIFGVDCAAPLLYSHFATTIRNRIEVWDSDRWESPMRNDRPPEKGWERFPGKCTVNRPTKLLEGSRGGQAFMAEILRPKESGNYSLVAQARMQLLSVLFVAVALLHKQDDSNVLVALREDFSIAESLSEVFLRLYWGLTVSCILLFGLIVVVCYDLFACGVLGTASPYVIKLAALAAWAIGAIGILMLGGNPRVRIVKRDVDAHIAARIDALPEDPNTGLVELSFGYNHGGTFKMCPADKCFLPRTLVRRICGWDVQLVRPLSWMIGMAWGFMMLGISIALQIVGSGNGSLGPEILNVGLLIITALLRGTGLSGKEEWQIPRWKMRKGTTYGAVLVGYLTGLEKPEEE